MYPLQQITHRLDNQPSSIKSKLGKFVNSYWWILQALLLVAWIFLLITHFFWFDLLPATLYLFTSTTNLTRFLRWRTLDFPNIENIVIEESETFKKRVFVETPKDPFCRANEILSAYGVKLSRDIPFYDSYLLQGRRTKETIDCLNITELKLIEEVRSDHFVTLWYQKKRLAEMRLGDNSLKVYALPRETAVPQENSEYSVCMKYEAYEEAYIGYLNQLPD